MMIHSCYSFLTKNTKQYYLIKLLLSDQACNASVKITQDEIPAKFIYCARLLAVDDIKRPGEVADHLLQTKKAKCYKVQIFYVPAVLFHSAQQLALQPIGPRGKQKRELQKQSILTDNFSPFQLPLNVSRSYTTQVVYLTGRNSYTTKKAYNSG